MSHYYAFDPSLSSNPHAVEVYFENQKLIFTTDVGVFSKKEIDFGSFTLIKTLLNYPSVDTMLDIGCGYGVIGLSLAYFKKCNHVEMIDINQRAIELTNKNCQNLSIKNVVIYQSNGLSKVTHLFERIVTNPPIRAGKKVIYQMFEDSFHHLLEKGELWVVIKKDLGAPSAQKKLQELFAEVEVVLKHKGYWIIRATKK